MAMVARRAGVSGQTVSRVVNDSPRVDPETRARVEEAMAALGYLPNRAARALRTGRSHVIGLVATTLATVGNSRMLHAVADEAERRGYVLLVVTASSTEAVARAFERLREQGADGAVILNEASALARTLDAPADLPLVIVDAAEAKGVRAVHSDHARGAQAATAHLLAEGHENVAHLAGPAGSFAADERERGWRTALGGRQRIVRGDWTADSGFAAAERLAAASAVFCANDQMALGLIRGLAKLGRRVPEDVSIVGFDDVPEAANYLPPLTTVRQDFAALAAQTMMLLDGEVRGDDPSRSVAPIPAPLVVRESTRAR